MSLRVSKSNSQGSTSTTPLLSNSRVDDVPDTSMELFSAITNGDAGIGDYLLSFLEKQEQAQFAQVNQECRYNVDVKRNLDKRSLKEKGISNSFLSEFFIANKITEKELLALPQEILTAQPPQNLDLLKKHGTVLCLVARLLVEKNIAYEDISNLNETEIKILENPHIQNYIRTGKLTLKEALTKRTSFENFENLFPSGGRILCMMPALTVIGSIVTIALCSFFTGISIISGIFPIMVIFSLMLFIMSPLGAAALSVEYKTSSLKVKEGRFLSAAFLYMTYYLLRDCCTLPISPFINFFRFIFVHLFSIIDPVLYPSTRKSLNSEGVKKYVNEGKLNIYINLINNLDSHPKNLDSPLIQKLIDNNELTIKKALNMPPEFLRILTWFFPLDGVGHVVEEVTN